ncbi:MAG: tyrosine-type recombinase/integrase [bacterium]
MARKGQKYSKEWLTIEERDKLFASPDIKARDLLLMRTCYYGALRINEALISRQEDYVREGEYAFLVLRSQKTDKKNWEKQPIPMHLYSEIKRYCEANDIKTQDYVFQSRQRDHLSYQRAIQIVKKCAVKVKLNKNITTHTFRRSRLQHMLDAGEDPYFAQDFARHKSIDTTRNYLKISKIDIAEKMNQIDKKI